MKIIEYMWNNERVKMRMFRKASMNKQKMGSIFASSEWMDGYNSALENIVNDISKSRKSYSIIKMSSSYCTKCGSLVNLLTPTTIHSLLPQFVICPQCGFIGSESGEVKLHDSKEPSI